MFIVVCVCRGNRRPAQGGPLPGWAVGADGSWHHQNQLAVAPGAVPRAPVPMYPPVGQLTVTPARATVRTKPTKVTRPKPAPAWQPPGTKVKANKGSSSSGAAGMFNADGTFR